MFLSEGVSFDDRHGPLPAIPMWEDQSGCFITRHASTYILQCYRRDAGGFQFPFSPSVAAAVMGETAPTTTG